MEFIEVLESRDRIYENPFLIEDDPISPSVLKAI